MYQSFFLALFTTILMTMSPISQAAGELHPEIANALSYQLPRHACEYPRPKRANQSTTAQRRMEKKMKKYRKCLETYKADIFEDFTRLKSVAQHGLTQQQATVILGKMKAIQLAIESSFGLPMTDAQAREMFLAASKNG